MYKQHEKTDDKDIYYYDSHRIRVAVRLLITLAATLILIVPVYVLLGTSSLTTGMVKVTIILLFTLAFAFALATCTRASRQEIFAATAA
ncbi:hypothetical protein GP486_001422 [Trichoglossum hirsutum]|uniref:DUF6594 domain-containing protein n=1 Tax=Trichoglossum hirsutum TaxID=265104 RepID=A0A9P8LGP2_9PEZI|nr:hypothetical protein GP486_001422 [Trichoglossum hirsutum]